MKENDAIQSLLELKPYSLAWGDKQKILLPVLSAQALRMSEAIPELGRYVARLGFKSGDHATYEELPFIPASLFKSRDLCAVPSEDIVRTLTSSGTTGTQPSRIILDKVTSFRQTKALGAIMGDTLGGARRPLLVLDTESSNAAGGSLTARGAAIRGISMFASNIKYAFKGDVDDPEIDTEAVDEFTSLHTDEEVLLFGFTFIIWEKLLARSTPGKSQLFFPKGTLLHSGGWKHLNAQGITKEMFNSAASGTLGLKQNRVIDFYGMVEQVGIIFPDCEEGFKHTPVFAEVLIRDFLSLNPVGEGRQGFIQVMSALPNSYPGYAIMTDDVGICGGYDHCPCGRRGFFFKFRSRAERSEVRGCGDVFGYGRNVGDA